jgi:hypothetical protein
LVLAVLPLEDIKLAQKFRGAKISAFYLFDDIEITRLVKTPGSFKTLVLVPMTPYKIFLNLVKI